jgi:hypothetical protein
MKLDCPDSHGSEGNSNTAAMARRLFKEEIVDELISLINGTPEELEAFATLHKNIAIILRVYSSKEHLIDEDSYSQLCTDTYLVLVESFPWAWATVPQSVHRVLAHTAERIRMNGMYGMGDLSEEGLETLHKLVRRFCKMLARKTNLLDNLTDVFAHLWIRSDPVIRSKKKTLECTHCSGFGHTKRSCLQLHYKKKVHMMKWWNLILFR